MTWYLTTFFFFFFLIIYLFGIVYIFVIFNPVGMTTEKEEERTRWGVEDERRELAGGNHR